MLRIGYVKIEYAEYVCSNFALQGGRRTKTDKICRENRKAASTSANISTSTSSSYIWLSSLLRQKQEDIDAIRRVDDSVHPVLNYQYPILPYYYAK